MSVRRSERPPSGRRRARTAQWCSLGGLLPVGLLLLGSLLVVGAGLGCVRTTSIGRASSSTDAQLADAGTDTSVDMGPIIGGGRDAATDGADDADTP